MKIATIKREPEDMVYTVEEVATIMRASKQYVYTLINANQIRVLKIPHPEYSLLESQVYYNGVNGMFYITARLRDWRKRDAKGRYIHPNDS